MRLLRRLLSPLRGHSGAQGWQVQCLRGVDKVPYFHYKPALSISLLEATANIPILCPLCNATIWCRSAQHHFGVAHVGVALPPALDLAAAAGSRDKILAGVGKVANSAVRATKKRWHIGSEPTFASGSAGVVIGVRGAGGNEREVVLQRWTHLAEA